MVKMNMTNLNATKKAYNHGKIWSIDGVVKRWIVPDDPTKLGRYKMLEELRRLGAIAVDVEV